MAPISVLPPDDEDSWVIAETIIFDKIPQYVVHPKGKPVVRRVVRKEDILDWVSLRELEVYESKEFNKEYDEENEKEKQAKYNKRARSGKKRRRLFKHQIGSASAAESREHSDIEMGEASVDLFAEDTSIPQQPSLSQPSLSQPNLSYKRKYHSSLNNQDTEGTEEDTADFALALDSPLASNISRKDKRQDPTRKAPNHAKDTFSSQEKQNITEAHSHKRDQQSRSLDEDDIIPAKPTKLAREAGHPSKRNSPILQPSRTPIHSTESLPASRENLGSSYSLRDRSSQSYYGRPTRASRRISVTDSGSPRKIESITTSGRITRSSSSIGTPATRQLRSSQTPTKSNRYPEKSQDNSASKTISYSSGKRSKYFSSPDKYNAPSSSKEEMTKDWPVIRLLDDKYRKIKQRRRHFYLVEWAGDYEPTWEPGANVSDHLIKAYERRKEHEAATTDDDSRVRNKSERSSRNANGGGNEVQEKRGSTKDADEPSDESGLFVTDEDVQHGENGVNENGRSRFFSNEQDEGDAGEESGSLIPNGNVKRGGNKIHGKQVGAFILSSEDEHDASREEPSLSVANEGVKEEKSGTSKLASVPDYLADAAGEGWML